MPAVPYGQNKRYQIGKFHESFRRGHWADGAAACAETGFCLGRKRLTLNTVRLGVNKHDCVAVFPKLKTPSNATSREYSNSDRKQIYRYLPSSTEKEG
jgi:hypothetical protein